MPVSSNKTVFTNSAMKLYSDVLIEFNFDTKIEAKHRLKNILSSATLSMKLYSDVLDKEFNLHTEIEVKNGPKKIFDRFSQKVV